MLIHFQQTKNYLPKSHRTFQKLKLIPIMSRKSFLQHATSHKRSNIFRVTEQKVICLFMRKENNMKLFHVDYIVLTVLSIS